MLFAEFANSFHDIRLNLGAPAALQERGATPAYSVPSRRPAHARPKNMSI
jgi:hypothetical protein